MRSLVWWVLGATLALLALLALAGALLAFVRSPGASADEGVPARQSILGPVLLGVVAAIGFELVAVRSPELALTGLASAAALVALVVGWVGRSIPMRRSPEAVGAAAVADPPRTGRSAGPTEPAGSVRRPQLTR